MKRKHLIIAAITGLCLMPMLFLAVGNSADQEIQEILKVAPLNPEFEAAMAEMIQGTYSCAPSDGFSKGYFPPPVDIQAINADQALTMEPLALPTSWDWRTHHGVTSVKDQGLCRSGWSFAHIGAIESRYKIVTSGHPTLDLSEENMNSGHLPWLWTRCAGGNSFIALSYLTNVVKKTGLQQFQKGILTEAQDPYKATPTSIGTHNPALCADATRPLPKYRITGARWISNSAAAMKSAIYANGPIVTAYYGESPGGSHWHSSNTVYHWPGSPQSNNHQVLIVGWDDNKPWPSGGGKGAWIVKPSWGNFNSLGGYFYSTYGSARVGTDGMYYTGIRTAPTEENLYMEDRPGWTHLVGKGGTTNRTAYGLTVFRPVNAKEKLVAVEFYNPFTNMPYTIKVWGKVSGSTRISVSTLKAAKTGNCKEPGYYMIPLSTPLPLTKGARYGVEVKFTASANYGCPVPCAGTIPKVIGAFAGTGNASGYGRLGDTGAFSRWGDGGMTLVPNVRARTSYSEPPTDIPSAPKGASATAGNGEATINWNAVSDATSYNIYWSTTSGVTKTSGTKITGATSPYTHTSRTNGTTYYYVVTAANSWGESVESAQVSATPRAPTSLTLVGSYQSSEGLTAVYVVGTKVIIGFVNVDESGFEILDISDPATPIRMVHKSLSFHPYNFYVVNKTSLYIAGNTGLYISNIQDPNHPTEPKLIYRDNFTDVKVVGGLAYATGGAPDGLAVIDLNSGKRIGFYHPPCCTGKLYVKGNYAYVADGPDGGLQIINIANPSHPIFAGQYLGRWNFDVSVKDTYAYVTTSGYFRIINVTRPTAPTLVTEIGVWGDAHSIFISGNTAFVLSQELNMFDITNPASPKLLDRYYQSFIHTSGVSGNPTHVVVVDYYKMRVFKYL